MKSALLVVVGVSLMASATFAQVANTPELEALRGPYQRNLAMIAAARESRLGPIRRAYAAELDRLQRETTSRGDLDGALQVKAERERLASGKDPTAAERAKMPPAVAALRTRYEKEMEPQLAVLRDAEDGQKRNYLAALDALQRRYTVQSQLDKAAVVRTERELIGGPLPDRIASASSPGPVPVSPATAAIRDRQFDPAFAGKIAAAIRDNKLALSGLSRPNVAGSNSETISEGAVLVGFDFFESKSDGTPDVYALRPIYLTVAGTKEGVNRGQVKTVTNKVVARPGYAVGGILVYHTHEDGPIRGLQVVFMKMLPAEGRLDQSNGAYHSPWYGAIPHKDKPKELGGDGRPVVGVYGYHGADCDGIGLIQMSN